MKDPLRKRIPREILRDWRKYLVILLFMVFMIGVASGQYVAHDSMMASIRHARETLNIGDGRFELDQEASGKFIDAMETGKKADVRQYLREKGYAKADAAIAKAAGGAAVPPAMLDAARAKARREVDRKIDDEWSEIEKEYELNEKNFKARETKIYPHFYRNEKEYIGKDRKSDATIRVFRRGDYADQASFNEGRAPRNDREIAIDRMHADNVGLKIGDTIKVGNRAFKIVGLLSYINYLTLHEENTDIMFDAFGFDVGMVTPEAFEKLDASIHYNYVYYYKNKPVTEVQKGTWGDDFMKALVTQTAVYDYDIEDFTPEYQNQASNFAITDIDGDTTTIELLVMILIAVIAFIFAITISSTIEKEAPVIGTLLASGYTKAELIRHYMATPVIVTIIGAVIGNIVGYTIFKDISVGLYYNSYSLPACTTVASPKGLIYSTVIPLVLMVVINLFVIVRALRMPPLKFIRRDLKKTRRAKAVRLPDWKFLNRFRLRILLQNIPNYGILIFGLVFVEVMLCFAYGMPDSLNHYSQQAPNMLFTDHQYILRSMKDDDGKIIKTETPGAERFSMATLTQPKQENSMFSGYGGGVDEDINIYGYSEDSRYIDISQDLAGNEVYISEAYHDKYGISKGDTLNLSEKYRNKSYEFHVVGIYDYMGGVCVFMPNDNFNTIFDNDPGDFSGYFSDRKITDIDEDCIASVITKKEITKVTDQLQHSMGQFMVVFQDVLFILSIILIYLLTKIIIEKNENAISMSKILGFSNREIRSLYLRPTAILVVIFTLLSFAAGYYIMRYLFRMFIMQMEGWFTFYISPKGSALSILLVLGGYIIVSVFDMMRIRRIPMGRALKNIE